MSVIRITNKKQFIGLSTDTKPTTGVTAGSTFYEYDTGVMFVTYDGTNWTPKYSTSFVQATTIDLQQIAGAYDLYEATTGYVLVERFTLTLPNVNCADDAALTSIKVLSDTAPAVTLISAVAGAVANLTASKSFTYATPFILPTGKKLILTIAGGASDAATVCTVNCRYAPVIPGAYLAV